MKAEFGCIITDGSGKLGGKVVSKNHYGKYLKIKVSPAQPASTFRDVAQGYIRTLSRQWGTLTDDQRLTWFQAENDFKYKNVFGDTYKPAGYNLFLQHNINLLLTGQSVLLTAPSPGLSAAIQYASFFAFNSINIVVLSFSPVVPAGFAYKVYASTAWSAGINYGKDKYRYLGYLLPGSVSPYDLSTMYNIRLGSVGAVGNKIFLKLVPINLVTGEEFQPYCIFTYIQPSSNAIGLSWTDEGSISSNLQLASIAVGLAGVVMAGTALSIPAIYRSTNNGVSWVFSQNLSSATDVLCLLNVSASIWVCGSGGANAYIHRSIDDGLTWSLVKTVTGNSGFYLIVKLTSGRLLATTGATSANIYYSDDLGINWTLLKTFSPGTSVYSLTQDEFGTITAIPSAQKYIYQSNDDGASWHVVYTHSSNIAAYKSIYCGNGLILVFSNSNGSLLKSSDYGQSWRLLTSVLNMNRVNAFIISNNNIILAGGQAVNNLSYSFDFGESWHGLGKLFSETRINTLAFTLANHFLAGTYNKCKILISNP